MTLRECQGYECFPDAGNLICILPRLEMISFRLIFTEKGNMSPNLTNVTTLMGPRKTLSAPEPVGSLDQKSPIK